MRFKYNPQLIFRFFFLQLELSHFSGIVSIKVHGTLCAQLLLQFDNDSFET